MENRHRTRTYPGGVGLTEKFSIDELRHIMGIMNGDCIDVNCSVCASARVKLEALIKKEQEKPVKEVRDIGGISCVIEHTTE